MGKAFDEGRLPTSRRDLLGGGVRVSAALAVWSLVGCSRASSPDPLLDYVCDQTIPATATPGALAVKVPDFIRMAIAKGLAGAKGDELERLIRELDGSAGSAFMDLAPVARLDVLSRHDAACFASHDSAAKFVWPLVKRLILMGYYTSEAGASQELEFLLDPGGFKPDLPYRKGDRAQSTDYFGVLGL
jgi:hypothetical protein